MADPLGIDLMIELKPDTFLQCAWTQSFRREPWCAAYPVQIYDDMDGPLWIFGHEHGPTLIIRASSFETAWEIAIDESPTIDPSEVPEAYGSFEYLREWCPELWPEYFQVYRKEGEGKSMGPQAVADIIFHRRADEFVDNPPDLLEGYEYQSNSSGTGIVNVGHYAWLRELTHDDIDAFNLIVRISTDWN